MTPVLTFDIETVPDAASVRRAFGMSAELSDAAVLDWIMHRRRVQTGSDFLPLQYQRVVAASRSRRLARRRTPSPSSSAAFSI